MRIVAMGVVLAALAGTAALAETLNVSITVGTNERNGVCFVYLPLDPANGEGPELEISVKAATGNVNVGMSKLPGDQVNPRLEHQNAPLTLTFGGGKKIKTDKGDFRAGYYYKHVGWWADSKNGLAVLSALNDGTTVSADFDGLHYGPIKIQQSSPMKNYAHTWLKQCVERNGGTAAF